MIGAQPHDPADRPVGSALVTGGSSGIGLAIARMLSEEGYALTLAARGLERLEQASEDLGAQLVQADVSQEEDCLRLLAAHTAAFSGLDVLVNSAGIGVRRSIRDLSTEDWEAQFAVNIRGTFVLTREALPHLRETGGYVVNVASIEGTTPTPDLSGYSASKAAVISFTRSLAREEASTGVRATAICPSAVDTPMSDWTGIPGRELIQPADCAELVRSLLRLSPSARVPVVVIERAGEVV